MGMRTSFRIIVRAGQQWVHNKDSRLGAALAYYTLFSTTPLLVLAITLAGLVFEEDAARGQVVELVRKNVDEDSALAVKTLLDRAEKPKFDDFATMLGLGVLVLGALGVFLHLRGALCTIWKLEPPRGSTLLGILLDYLLALVMVLLCGGILLLSLVVSTAVPLVIHYFEDSLPDLALPWQLVEMALSFFFLTILFAVMYRVLSGRRIAYGYVFYGALIAALFFTFGKTLVGWYLAYFSPASAYGAAGSVVVFLLWVYYSSQILFFGAELIQARRTRAEWLNG